MWAITEQPSDRLIGTCAAFYVNLAQGRCEIGYSLHRHWQQQGMATESLRLVIAYLFEQLGLRRVEGDVDPRNVASCRLLEKLGFVREGLLRERWHVNGEACDSVLYGLLSRDYRG